MRSPKPLPSVRRRERHPPSTQIPWSVPISSSSQCAGAQACSPEMPNAPEKWDNIMNTNYLSRGLLILLIAASGPVSAQDRLALQLDSVIERQKREVFEELQRAAAASRVRLDPSTVTQLYINGGSSIVAAVLGDSAMQPGGANVAFGFFDLPKTPGNTNPSLPPGFYTIRIRPLQQPRGNAPGMTRRPTVANAQAEFVSASGNVVARVPAARGIRPPGATGSRIVSGAFAGSTGGTGRIIAYCMVIGGHWHCWGSHWMQALDWIEAAG